MDHEPSMLSKALNAPRGTNGTLVRITPEQFERLRKWTRRAADLPAGTRVRCVLDPDIDPAYLAWTERCNPVRHSYRIHVAAHVSFWHAADLILHEFAHVRQWLLYGQNVDEHGPEYGREFAYIYARWVLEAPGNPMTHMARMVK